jgi:UDP-N-acetylbacillosamine N-acetyltransferase
MDIVIIGSGGLAKEVCFLIEEVNRDYGTTNKYNILGYADTIDKIGTICGKYRVVMDDEDLVQHSSNIGVILGLGTPEISNKLIKKYRANPFISFPNIIHPNVVGDWDSIEMGRGNVICAGNVFTTDVKIKDFNYFNLSCTVGHDTSIGEFNIINPSVNISGGVNIGNNNLIGTGSQVLQYLKIGDNNIVGAGAVVSKEITDSGVYVGIPARRIKSK